MNKHFIARKNGMKIDSKKDIINSNQTLVEEITPQKEHDTNILLLRTSTMNEENLVRENKLIGKWDLYYHLPYDKKWDLNSYTAIIKDIETVDMLISINKSISELIIKQCMLFVMRNGITPRWEDPRNKNGGCFSFKVINKYVPSIWKYLFYATCGETIFTESKYNSFVNGITISPKKNFCIIKIWMENCSIQDPELIVPIPNLIKQGCLFRKHEPES